jgi:hypothetical protein
MTPIAIKSSGYSMVTAALFPLMVATPGAVLDAVLVPVSIEPVPLVAAATTKTTRRTQRRQNRPVGEGEFAGRSDWEACRGSLRIGCGIRTRDGGDFINWGSRRRNRSAHKRECNGIASSATDAALS